MTINLYYIDGISNIDTPYFGDLTHEASSALQEDYFDNNIVKSIEYSFYPPHYQNVIKFDSDDVDFNTTFNYLSLEFNEKRYYYFVDDIEYVSESIMRVYITMDVIQTYMFNIEIKSGIIERKFIDRWVKESLTNYMINRNYIRENLSEGEFIYNYREILNSNRSKHLVFITNSKIFNSTDVSVSYIYSDTPGFKKITSAYNVMMLPLVPVSIISHYYSKANSGIGATRDDTTEYVGDYLSLAYFLQQPECVNAYVCPFDCIDGIAITSEVGSLDYSKVLGYYTIHQIHYASNTYHMSAIVPYLFGDESEPTDGNGKDISMYQQLEVKTKVSRYNFNFTRNDDCGVLFSSNYMPQLLDENYIQYTFGSSSTYTSIPLYNLVHPYLQNKYTFNPADGTRLYWITREENDSDDFRTCVLDTNVITLDIKSNAYAEYAAANKGRWAAAIANTAIDVFTKGSHSLLRATFAKQDMNDIMFNPKSYDKRYKSLVLKRKYQEKLVGLQREEKYSNIDMANVGADAGGNILNQAIKESNVIATPPTPKQSGNLSANLTNEALIMKVVYKVNDYEQCAQYYHRNGYLINRYINFTDSLFEDIRIDEGRYYFNVLKMQLPEVHLRGVPEDELTVSLIKERLVSGLRLWNVDYPLDPATPQGSKVSIGDFQYDNVELSFIQ